MYGYGWNIFHYAGDISHSLSKMVLMAAIHRNKSAEGVSWITQVLYAIVFFSRYTDLFDGHQALWNMVLKWFYIISSIYIIFVMRFWFPRTREREVAWKLGAAILGGSLILSPFTLVVFHEAARRSFSIWLWDFSEILESVCVLPQLLLLRQTTVPTVINSFYLVMLGSYRAFYILNWILRAADEADPGPETVSVIFGIIQTALYVDFGWVYWTRQRVKLRNGGIVDSDDLQRGWLVNRILGRHAPPRADDEEGAPALRNESSRPGNARSGNKWGSRGISISADEGVLDGEQYDQDDGIVTGTVDQDARMQDPEELARALNESSSSEEEHNNSEDDEDDSDDSQDTEDNKDKPLSGKAATATGTVDSGTSAWRV